jgi:hypothetical protein
MQPNDVPKSVTFELGLETHGQSQNGMRRNRIGQQQGQHDSLHALDGQALARHVARTRHDDAIRTLFVDVEVVLIRVIVLVSTTRSSTSQDETWQEVKF